MFAKVMQFFEIKKDLSVKNIQPLKTGLRERYLFAFNPQSLRFIGGYS